MKSSTLLLLGAAGLLVMATRKPKPAPKKQPRIPLGGWTAAPPRPSSPSTPSRTTPAEPSRTNP